MMSLLKNIRVGTIDIIFMFFLLFSLLSLPNIFASETLQDETRVTFNLDQVPLKEVIRLIQLQTGYLVEIDRIFWEDLVSGTFVSIELTNFLKRIVKGHSVFVILSPKEKTIVVKAIKNDNFALQSGQVSHNQIMVDSLNSTVKSVISDEEIVEGISELDNTFPINERNDNHHIIDPQTGLTWEEAEKLMNR